MNTGDAIYILKKALDYLLDEPIAKPVVAALKLAIHALENEKMRQDPSVLSLEQLKNMYGQPVWVEHNNGGEWVTVHWNSLGCISTAYKATLDKEAYGDGWKAYPFKPGSIDSWELIEE